MAWAGRIGFASVAAMALAGGGPPTVAHAEQGAGLSRPAEASPPGLTATYFGTSTILLDDGRTRIMIDGFFSRPNIGGFGFGRLLGRRPIEPNKDRINDALKRGGVDRLDAIFVAHAHYDHVLDAPTVAKLKDAHLVGSTSTAHVARTERFGGPKLHEVAAGARCRFGDFVVTMHKTPHGRTPLPVNKKITAPLPPRPNIFHYKDGENFSFLVEHPRGAVLIVPSGQLDAGNLDGVKADAVFLGVAQLTRRGVTPPARHWDREAALYWKRAVMAPEARIVIPIHWDQLLIPLSEPLKPIRPLRPVPPPIDYFDTTMAWLADMAETLGPAGVKLILPQAFGRIDLAAEIGHTRRKPEPIGPPLESGTCSPQAPHKSM